MRIGGPDLDDLREAVSSFHNFAECLLHDVSWFRFGTEVHLVFNVIWDAAGQVRSDVLEHPRLVELRLYGVQDLEVRNHLTPGMLDRPELVNWGLSEVSRLSIAECDLGDREGVLVEVFWQGPRSIRGKAASAELIPTFEKTSARKPST